MKTCLIKNGLVRWISWMLAMLMLPSLADAHIVAGQTSGFVHGLVHPFTGFDHIAAMVAVGLWAAQRGGRALWVVPLTFVGVMSVSGLLGMTGFPFRSWSPALRLRCSFSACLSRPRFVCLWWRAA